MPYLTHLLRPQIEQKAAQIQAEIAAASAPPPTAGLGTRLAGVQGQHARATGQIPGVPLPAPNGGKPIKLGYLGAAPAISEREGHSDLARKQTAEHNERVVAKGKKTRKEISEASAQDALNATAAGVQQPSNFVGLSPGEIAGAVAGAQQRLERIDRWHRDVGQQRQVDEALAKAYAKDGVQVLPDSAIRRQEYQDPAEQPIPTVRPYAVGQSQFGYLDDRREADGNKLFYQDLAERGTDPHEFARLLAGQLTVQRQRAQGKPDQGLEAAALYEPRISM